MVTLDWETERTDGVTFVRLYVTSEYRRHVRVENRLDGPVWPPRREGQPAAGWDGDAFEGVVAPGERLVAGYATPAPPADPPAEVVSEDPADPETPPGPAGSGGFDPLGEDGRLAATDGGGETETTTGAGAASGRTTGQFRFPADEDAEGPADGDPSGAVVRSLGDPVVPREAVPVPDATDGDGDGSEDAVTGRDGGQRSERPGREPTDRPDGPDERGEETTDGDRGGGKQSGVASEPESGGGTPLATGPDGATPPGTDAELVVPGAVRAWLRDVDRRLNAVERRRAAETTDADPTLQVAVAADRRALSRVAERVETLVGRTEAVERRAGGDGRR